jgi:hypothetical protein
MNSDKDLTDSQELKDAYNQLLKKLSPLDNLLFVVRYT